ncbi:MAG: HypC/HybG/HupF family hydrogenase formation chaperone [Bacteroidetes bacterium]|nr:HypC/HybG/HupF family hydrogenase formation chaperone [Bacteroidota bacterium]
MCLAVPGRVTRIDEHPRGLTMGKVDFAGISKEVCLAYVPDVKVGNYVIVHVGFAISILNEKEAEQVFEYFKQVKDPGESEFGPGTLEGGGEDA